MTPLTKRELFFLSILIALGAILVIPWEHFFGSKIESLEEKSQEFFAAVLPKKIIGPEPLRHISQAITSNLTTEGVFLETNNERKANGLKALVLNDRLNATAERKITDMFEKQYFAHESPDGTSAGDLARDSGYDYIIIGENLALGNFKDDKELVEAWMQSPGHRANILNKRYEEIGVAVRKGRFEGDNQWIAVQTFGVPSSSCKSPDESTRLSVETEKTHVLEIEKTLSEKKAEIDQMEQKWGEKYNKAVQEYNALVGTYNSLVRKLRALITKYNNEVKAYNACVEG